MASFMGGEFQSGFMTTWGTHFSCMTALLQVTKWRGYSVPRPSASRLAAEVVIAEISSFSTDMTLKWIPCFLLLHWATSLIRPFNVDHREPNYLLVGVTDSTPNIKELPIGTLRCRDPAFPGAPTFKTFVSPFVKEEAYLGIRTASCILVCLDPCSIPASLDEHIFFFFR